VHHIALWAHSLSHGERRPSIPLFGLPSFCLTTVVVDVTHQQHLSPRLSTPSPGRATSLGRCSPSLPEASSHCLNLSQSTKLTDRAQSFVAFVTLVADTMAPYPLCVASAEATEVSARIGRAPPSATSSLLSLLPLLNTSKLFLFGRVGHAPVEPCLVLFGCLLEDLLAYPLYQSWYTGTRGVQMVRFIWF
jgi:hypothetical protein